MMKNLVILLGLMGFSFLSEAQTTYKNTISSSYFIYESSLIQGVIYLHRVSI